MRLPPRTIRSPPKDPKTIGDGRRGQAWSLVIPIAWFHLASENPIGISGVGQNDRDQDDCANKGKCKAAVGGGGFPDGERRCPQIRTHVLLPKLSLPSCSNTQIWLPAGRLRYWWGFAMFSPRRVAVLSCYSFFKVILACSALGAILTAHSGQ